MHNSPRPANSIPQALRRIRRLIDRRYRETETRFWIEGIRNFVQAFDANIEFDTVVISPILLKSDLAEMLARRLSARGIPRLRITPEQFRSISTADRASGIGAIVKQPWLDLEKADPRRGIGWIVLEEIRSPGNLGTILRTAEAAGMTGIIFLGPKSDPFHPTVVRAAMGGIFHLQLVRTNHARARRWASEHGIHFVGLSPNAERLWTQTSSENPLAIVIGEERAGISDACCAMCQSMVRLPMTGTADSINVGVSAGIMMYEIIRQRLTQQSPILG